MIVSNIAQLLQPMARFPASYEDARRLAATGVLGDEQLHVLLLFDRRIDAARMNRALHQMFDLYPVLGCQLVVDADQVYWERRSDLDSQSLWTVHIESGLLPPEARPGVYRFVISPSNPLEQPVLQARLFRSTSDMLCLKLHHSASDAYGLKTIVYALAHLYAQEQSGANLHPTLPQQPFERDIRQALQRLPLRAESVGSARPAVPADSAQAWKISSIRLAATQRPAYTVHKVPLMVFKSMRAYAARKQASLESLLMIAFYQALRETLTLSAKLSPSLDVRPSQMGLEIDLRPQLPPDMFSPVANLSHTESFTRSLPSGERIGQHLERVSQAIEAQLARQEWLGAVAMRKTLGFSELRRQIEAQRQGELAAGEFSSASAAPCLGFYGALDAERLAFGGPRILDAYLLGPVQFAPRLQVNCSYIGDSMTLSANYPSDAIEPMLVDRLLAVLIAQLADF